MPKEGFGTRYFADKELEEFKNVETQKDVEGVLDFNKKQSQTNAEILKEATKKRKMKEDISKILKYIYESIKNTETNNSEKLKELLENAPHQYHQIIADNLIRSKNETFLINNLKLFKDLNQNIAEQLLKKEKEFWLDDLANNLYSFKDLSSSLAKEIIAQNFYNEENVNLRRNIDKFKHIDKQDLIKLFDIKENRSYSLADRYLLELSERSGNQDLAEILLENYQPDLLNKYLHLFGNLDKTIAEKLFQEGYASNNNFFNNLASFKNLDRAFFEKFIREGCNDYRIIDGVMSLPISKLIPEKFDIDYIQLFEKTQTPNSFGFFSLRNCLITHSC